MEGLAYEEEDLNFETKPKLFSIDIIILSEEMILLLSVGVSKLEALKNLIQSKGHHIKQLLKLCFQQ
jgi:hypothetical protein